MMGYIRYALILEVLSGIVMGTLVVQFLKNNTIKYNMLSVIIAGMLLFQVGQSIYTVAFTSTELSWRQTIFKDDYKYKVNIKAMLKNYDYSQYLEDVDCFGIVDYNSGYARLLSDNIPIISLLEGYSNEYGEEQFNKVLDKYSNKRIFIISTRDTIKRTIEYLNKTEFKLTGEMKIFEADFLDATNKLILLEVTRLENQDITNDNSQWLDILNFNETQKE